MLEVSNNFIMEDEEAILMELKHQLQVNGIDRFNKIIRTSDNLQTNCPFHNEGQERKPSFGILLRNKGKQKEGTCHCFACGWTGSFAEMVSNCFGHDDMGKYGMLWLVKNFISGSTESRPDIPLDVMERRLLQEPISPKYITEDELSQYRWYHDYMWQRGLTPELVSKFDIGYCQFRNTITFPIRDENGNCLFVAERSVKTKYFHLEDSMQKPLYGLYELYQEPIFPKTVYVCEGVFDALAWWRVGRPAVALLGLGSDFQIKQLRRLPCRQIVLALDNDNAGRNAILKLSKLINTKMVKKVSYPNNKKDAGECTDEELLSIEEVFV